MRRLLITGLAALAMAGAAEPKEREMKQRDVRSTDLPLPRDGNIAIREELDVARRARTLAAYDLFIARHPGHPLETVARREREEIARRAARPRT